MSRGRPGAPGDANRLPPWARGWLGDSAMLLVANGATIVATTFAAVVIARDLGPADWGVFSGFLGLSLAMGLVVESGLSMWLLRELSRLFTGDNGDRREASRLMSASLALNGVLALLLVGGGLLVSLLRSDEAALTTVLVALLLYGGLSSAASVLEAHLRAERRIRRIVAANLAEKYALVGLVIGAAAADFGLVGIGLAYVLPVIGRVLFLAGSVFASPEERFVLPTRSELRTAAVATAPFALTGGALNLLPRLDTFVILLFSAAAAGNFAVGDRIVWALLIIPATLGATLYPFMASGARRGRTVARVSVALGAAGAALALIGFFLAPTLVPLVFGDSYDDAIPVVRVLLLALPLIFAASPLLTYGYSCGHERLVFLASIVPSVVGTGLIVAGQATSGVVLAAGGVVARTLLLLVALALVARAASAKQDGQATPLRMPMLETSR